MIRLHQAEKKHSLLTHTRHPLPKGHIRGRNVGPASPYKGIRAHELQQNSVDMKQRKSRQSQPTAQNDLWLCDTYILSS